MPKRIDELTSKQKSQIDAWADKWIEIGLRTGEIDLQTFTEGTKEAYGFAGIPWHSNVIVVDNPLVMALAAPIAGLILNNIAVRGAVHGAVNGAVRDAVIGAVSNAVDDAVRAAVGGAVNNAVRGAVGGAVRGTVGNAVGGAVGDAVDNAVRDAVRGAVRDAVHGAVVGAVGDAVGDAVGGAVVDAVGGAVNGAVGDAVGDAVDNAVRDAVDDAVRGAVGGAVGDAVGIAVVGAVRDAVDDAVNGAVGGAVAGAVIGAVSCAVRGAVGDAVVDAVGIAVAGAVRVAVRVAVGNAVGDAVVGAVDGTVDNAVGGAVDNAVGDAVRVAVGGAVDAAVVGAVGIAVDAAVVGAVDDAVGNLSVDSVRKAILDNYRKYLGGQFWVGGWYWGNAYVTFFRDVCDLELSQDILGRMKAYEKINTSACVWYPHERFIMVSKRPKTINLELVDPNIKRGWNSHRLHNETGTSIEWDGFALYHIHGVRVPEYVVMRSEEITVLAIESETNAEVRRIMMEKYGYERYMRDCNAVVVDECASDHEIIGLRTARLLVKQIPDDEPVVYIDVLNSTPETDGTTKRYMLRVDPRAYNGMSARSCHAAIASTWRTDAESGNLVYQDYQDYRPVFES